MEMHETSQQGASLRRLNLVGKVTAFLAWALSLNYVFGTIWMWLFNGHLMTQGIISSFADAQPLLLTPAFHLSAIAGGLLVLLDVLPVIVTSLIFF